MEINRDAPVRAEREIEIAAPPEVVWDVLTTIVDWPRWNVGVKSASIAGPVEPRWDVGDVLMSVGGRPWRILDIEPSREGMFDAVWTVEPFHG